MRVEYEILQRLLWDAGFRRRFIGDRRRALKEEYPQYRETGLFGERATAGGLEEDAFRRMTALCQTSQEIYPCSHPILLAYVGDEFFERVLTSFHQDYVHAVRNPGVLEILEPFDGYVVGLFMAQEIEKSTVPDRGWIAQLMSYEWAVWHANRVAHGWPALYDSSPLTQGSTLVHATFDLKKVLKEIRRLRSASVGGQTYIYRIRPPTGSYRAVVYPKDGNVLQATVDETSFEALKVAIADKTCEELDAHLRAIVNEIGLVVSNSFLCCPKAEESSGEVDKMISTLVEPLPH